ncbi:MAG TPA: hypothetical protein VHM88_18340 [Candidatus Acidoferrales bacterium]|nr:hypothetical protein [Candidatus Acidoferrales bacterium]
MIRHAVPLREAAPILALTVAMILTPFGALLMAAIRSAPLLAISLVATGRTAVTLSSVAVAADPEQLVAGEANPLPQNDFAAGGRHLASQAGLDNGDRSWQGRTAFGLRFTPTKG